MVARRAHNPEAVGSSPASATTHKKLENSLVFFAANLRFTYCSFQNTSI
ncbi:MAG: hypothetical protein K0R93_1155 [Anaerosolibacter sp.]|nr:hypothetical protein [Anaerosolibacter sp.]